MLGRNTAFSTPPTSTSTSTGGGGGGGTLAPTVVSLVAGEALGYPRVVNIIAGKAYLFNPLTAIAGSVVGLTTASVALGAIATIQPKGELLYTGWGLVTDKVMYAGANGVLSVTPPSSGLVQPIGVALTSDTLLIRPSVAIA